VPYAVYHYTDAASLNAISRPAHLGEDLLYLAGRARPISCATIRDHLRQAPRQRSGAARVLREGEQRLDPRTWRSIFATCFCQNGDRARAVARLCRPARGYAVGLRSQA
jgi:hypothetical protein